MNRFCEDCRWLQGDNSCHAPRNRVKLSGGSNLVRRSGETGIEYGLRWLTASHQRSLLWPIAVLFRACGRSARWFEPVVSHPQEMSHG